MIPSFSGLKDIVQRNHLFLSTLEQSGSCDKSLRLEKLFCGRTVQESCNFDDCGEYKTLNDASRNGDPASGLNLEGYCESHLYLFHAEEITGGRLLLVSKKPTLSSFDNVEVARRKCERIASLEGRRASTARNRGKFVLHASIMPKNGSPAKPSCGPHCAISNLLVLLSLLKCKVIVPSKNLPVHNKPSL